MMIDGYVEPVNKDLNFTANKYFAEKMSRGAVSPGYTSSCRALHKDDAQAV